jgi:hypothetical protein
VVNRAAFRLRIARKNPQLRQPAVTPCERMAANHIEAAMLRHRIIPASAVLLAVTIGSAAAQEQPSAGKPLQLLQFARHAVRHEAKAPLHPHAATVERLAKHAEVKRHIATKTVAKHRKLFASVHHPRVAEAPPAPQPAQPAAAAAQPAVWPAVDSAAPVGIAIPAPPAAARIVKTEPVVSDTSDAIVTDNKVAQAAPPPPEATAPKVAADPHPAAAPPAPDKSAAAAPAARAMIVRPAGPDADAKKPVGSTPWLLQVLAALGGALTAGAVAWFFILRGRSEPQYEEFFAEAPAPGE